MFGKSPFCQRVELTRALIPFDLCIPIGFRPLGKPGANLLDLLRGQCCDGGRDRLDSGHCHSPFEEAIYRHSNNGEVYLKVEARRQDFLARQEKRTFMFSFSLF